MSNLLVAIRTVHFAASVLLAGTVVFAALVVRGDARDARKHPQFAIWCEQTSGIVWTTLATAILSGVAWLVVLAADISGKPLHEVFADDIVWRVLANTRFGFTWGVRFAVALLLAIGWIALARRPGVPPRWQVMSVVALALSLVGSLAWSGHASGTPGVAGDVHIAADVLHLIAAGIWVGGLVPLALLLAAARRANDAAAATIARQATLRFSTLGMMAVATLLVTGVINACVLVGSVAALVRSDYGRLLLVKVCLFAAMVCVAAVNRQRLTPRLSSVRGGADAQRQLQRNSLIEASMGALILVIVGAMGTLPPALHDLPAAHLHGRQ